MASNPFRHVRSGEPLVIPATTYNAMVDAAQVVRNRRLNLSPHAERASRETSDFLKYVDSHGKYADFHGLRHTFVTNLARANVSPKMAQTLARHSDIKLTMSIYTHVAPVEQAAAIKALPGFGKTKNVEY